MSNGEAIRDESLAWFLNNLGTINKVIYESWYLYKKSFPVELDHRWARFTEMSLCITWDIIAAKLGILPSNFQVIDGSVRVDGSMFQNHHTFLERVDENGDRWIMCHTASQFMLNDGETVRQGDRIKELQRRAKGNGRSDLVMQVGNYAVVYGRAKDIMQVLGLEYLPYS